ncbi:MAG: hypothetical protein Q8P46_11970 [Hyphomicrobiales bacterium]|nr:hypothetical protein [Hyphomicrobiales bacterium]
MTSAAVLGFFVGLGCGFVLGVMFFIAYSYGVCRWLTKRRIS